MSANNASRPPAVLAIDDDENILDIIKTCLEGEGFVVQTHNNPVRGVEWYTQRWQEVDVVLLDYIMPEMNGAAVFERLRRANPRARVILLTACDDHVAEKLFQEGLHGYIQKPFYLKQLLQQVQEAITAP